MCGIAGYLARNGVADTQVLERMADAVSHRGPDDCGVWVDEAGAAGLAHRRLAIIDLSIHGHQPMTSHCGRYVVVLNGEIYNHLELRRALGEQPWRGHSDTETLLACFTRYGVQATLGRIGGMFAFAVWDRQRRQLLLARDRMGEKPLYYGQLSSGDFVFGSELKALRAHPRWHGEIDREALALYVRHNCVPAPFSIYREIRKLRPGHWCALSADGRREEGCYWDLVEVARRARAVGDGQLTDAEAIAGLETVLGDAVRAQMLSDMPLGAFLSGGVDSSTIVALMTRFTPGKVRTFTIGFREPGFDEAGHAREIARHLGTDHTEAYVTGADALAVVPRLARIYDEPFADSSQVPTFLVSQIARRHVTVALSGDAGDELFAGYSRYLLAQTVWRRLESIPLSMRRILARRLVAIRPGAIEGMMRAVAPLLPRPWRLPAAGDKLHKFADRVLCAVDPAEMYRALVSHWSDPSALVLDAREPASLLQNAAVQQAFSVPVEWMSLMDQLTYLPDDILVKVDRAAMAVALETRAPFLDPRVVEYSWSTPLHRKIRDGKSKWLLRQVLYRHVPERLIERPKQGFSIPLDQWLRGPLRDWAEPLLQASRLVNEGFFDVVQVRRKWQEHQSGARNWQYLIWGILMFQAWLDATREPASATRWTTLSACGGDA